MIFSIKDLVKKVLNRLKLYQLHGFFEVWLKKLLCVLGWLFFQTLSLFLQYSDHQIFSDTLNCSKNILWKKMVNIITHFLSYIEDCYRSCETPLNPPPQTMSLKRWSDKRGIPWQYTSFYVFMHAKQVIQIFSSEPFGEIHSNEGQRSHSWRYQKQNSKFISPFPQDQLSQISTNHNLI